MVFGKVPVLRYFCIFVRLFGIFLIMVVSEFVTSTTNHETHFD